MCDMITHCRFVSSSFSSADAIGFTPKAKGKRLHKSSSKTQQQLPSPVFLANHNLNFSQNAVVAVAAGTYHSLAVTRRGQVFVWGSGKHGRLGLGTERVALRWWGKCKQCVLVFANRFALMRPYFQPWMTSTCTIIARRCCILFLLRLESAWYVLPTN